MTQNLCFKGRGLATVQLVRHLYTPSTRRSRTVTLGSLRRDADPEDFDDSLRLRPGMVLTPRDRMDIVAWLLREGDPAAAARRRAAAERAVERARVRRQSEADARPGGVLAAAEEALSRAVSALPDLVAGKSPADARQQWRPAYQALHGAWGRFVEAAQVAGIARRVRRTGGSPRRESPDSGV